MSQTDNLSENICRGINRRDFLKGSLSTAVTVGLGNVMMAGEALPRQKREAEEPGQSFSFCVIADPHCAEKASKRERDYPVAKYGNHVDRFFKCLAQIEKLPASEKPDFVLVVGDIHLWVLRKHLGRIKIPLHVISGNHEGNKKKKQEMRDLFPNDFKLNGKPADYYAFVHKGVRFIGLCDAGTYDHIGHFCSENIIPGGQCEWFEGQLKQRERRKIIFAHIPPHPRGKDIGGYLSRNDSIYLNALIRQHQPVAMFFGHQHSDTRSLHIGKTLSVTLRSCAWNRDKSPLGFMYVQVGADTIRTREIII